jgi:hypothetical protein
MHMAVLQGLSKSEEAEVRLLVNTSIQCQGRFRVEIISIDPSGSKCNRIHVYIFGYVFTQVAIFSTFL